MGTVTDANQPDANAIPPPPRIESDDEVYLFGFPLYDLPAAYRSLVAANWQPDPRKEGDFPDLMAILEAVRRRTPPGIKVTLLEVWAPDADQREDKILSVIAVASASRDCPRGSVRRSEEELAAVAHAAKVLEVEDIKPVWLLSAWRYDELKEFDCPGLEV